MKSDEYASESGRPRNNFDLPVRRIFQGLFILFIIKLMLFMFLINNCYDTANWSLYRENSSSIYGRQVMTDSISAWELVEEYCMFALIG